MKLKTHKATAKRIVKITKKGKILRRRLSAQHLVKRKSKRTVGHNQMHQEITGKDAKRIKKMLPYGGKYA